MKVLTFDLETENHRLYKRLAAPFDPRNYVVEAGWSFNGGKRFSQRWEAVHREHFMVNEFNSLEKGDVICGFNIKFDLMWCWSNPALQAALKRGVTIYCGQYAEYLLGGMVQEVQMCSMNGIAEKYGGGCKLDAVKEMWEDGYLTSEIPADMLHDYLVGDDGELVGDIQNTWLIYCGQVRRMLNHFPKEFRTMFKHRMDGLLATTEMEWNGMYIDAVRGATLQAEVSSQLDSATKELEQFIPALPDGMTFNWNSNVHKSCLIFGGTAKYEKWKAHEPEAYAQKTVAFPLFGGEPVNPDECKLAGAVFVKECVSCTAGRVIRKGNTFYLVQDTFKGGQKVGQPKTKNVQVDDHTKRKGAITDFFFKFEGFTTPKPKWKGAKTDANDEPLYSVGADVIEELAKRKVPFTDALAKQTSLSKDLTTYYWAIDKKGVKKGMLTLVNGDGIIHHTLHHVKTVTSRMSASDPNMQNIPRAGTSKIKQVFTSRFGDEGRMAEIDYSQLEVVIQGVLTEDKQLCQDLRDRVDFHCKRLATKEGLKYEDVLRWCKGDEIPEWVDKRTKAKIFSFQRAYGAGVNTIVESTGMSKNDVEALIAAENVLYPDVLKFDQRLEKHILENRTRVEDRKLFHNGLAFNLYESHWDSPTGTRYVWRENITPEFMHKKGKFTGFSPTERKNYPMQGLGGEIMQTMLGKVWRYFLENDYFNGDVLLVNTVHDCLLLDGKSEELMLPVAEEVQRILETVPEVFNKAFPDTLNITVPFPAETEMGHDLFDMKVIHF